MLKTSRFKLVSSGITASMRDAAFPSDEPLEDKSKQLAVSLRDRFSNFSDQALCGPALRARQTAELLGLHATVSEVLRDQDYGAWMGRSLPELEAEQPGILQAWTSDPLFAPPGGESITALCDRARSFLGDMAVMPGAKVVVTHGPLVRAAILCVLDAPVLSFWRIDTPPLSVAEFTFDGRRWALRLGVTT